MRNKLALLVTAAVFTLALVVAPAANASYIKVTASYSYADFCRAAPDQLSFRLAFKAKVKRRGVAKPDRVRIGYQVLDGSSRQVLASGKLSLKRSKSYKAKTSRIYVPAGATLLYHFNMSYKSGGRTIKSKLTDTDVVPTVEQLDQSALPPCPGVG